MMELASISSCVIVALLIGLPLVLGQQRCARGLMGDECDRPCRDFYASCRQWQTPSKCTELRPDTEFFDRNCAETCDVCVSNGTALSTELPLPPLLEPLAFLVGKWESSFSLPIRYPTDHYEQFYNEIIEIQPTNIIMFGNPSLNWTSESTSLVDKDDVRISRGFLSLNDEEDPPQVSLLSTSNEGLNTVEIGTLSDDGGLLLNMTYMQIHPALDLDVLPVGGSRLFRQSGPHLEMAVIKLDRKNRIGQFTKFFKKIKDFPLW